MPDRPPSEPGIGLGSTKSESIGWRDTIIALSFAIAIPIAFPLGMSAWKDYKISVKLAEIHAQHDATSLPAFNQLCNTFIKLGAEQQWKDTVEQWTKLCYERNKEYLEGR